MTNPSPDKKASTHDALQAPWRMQYLEDLEAESEPPKTASGTFLSRYWASPESDEKNHVIVRTPEGMVLLNAYPYANGHLLIALGDARPSLLDYEPAQRDTLWKLVEHATDIVQKALRPQGVNIGINQGAAAGAGVPEHLHVHVVPRWGGDTNFMQTVSRVRVIPAAIEVMAARFREVAKTVSPRD